MQTIKDRDSVLEATVESLVQNKTSLLGSASKDNRTMRRPSRRNGHGGWLPGQGDYPSVRTVRSGTQASRPDRVRHRANSYRPIKPRRKNAEECGRKLRPAFKFQRSRSDKVRKEVSTLSRNHDSRPASPPRVGLESLHYFQHQGPGHKISLQQSNAVASRVILADEQSSWSRRVGTIQHVRQIAAGTLYGQIG